MRAQAKYKFGIVDDHSLFRNGVKTLLSSLEEIKGEVTFEANDGSEMIEKLQDLSEDKCPDIIFLDINMPITDGFESVDWLKKNLPNVKIVILTMFASKEKIIRMLKLGVCSYLTKDTTPEEFKKALNSVINIGHYYNDMIVLNLIEAIQTQPEILLIPDDTEVNSTMLNLSEKEKEFLEYVCSDLTYNEIATKMSLTARTIEAFRNTLFEKLDVKSRVGLVMFAIKNRIYKFSDNGR